MIKEEPSISKLYPFPPLKTQKKLDLLFENHWPLKKHYQFCNPNVLLGVEIEVENIKNEVDLNHYWNCVEDNSLRNYGHEFVSRPLRARSIPYAIEHLKQALYYNNDPIFSNRTSVHVHLNVRDFTIERLQVFLLLYCVFEKHFFNIAGTRRENNIFCIPLWKSEQPIHLNCWPTDLQKWNKYNALNLGCILGNGINTNLGTIEFRHLYGTLDTDILYPWIDSIIHLRDFSRLLPLYILVEKIKNLNTTSEYISLYKQVFGVTCLDLNLISKLDFESCISQTKLNLFYTNQYKPFIFELSKYKDYYKKSTTAKPIINQKNMQDLMDSLVNTYINSTATSPPSPNQLWWSNPPPPDNTQFYDDPNPMPNTH